VTEALSLTTKTLNLMSDLSACGTHRQAGADQQRLDLKPKKRSNGCGSRGKNQAVLKRNSRQQKKKQYFFYKRSVFSLDTPFNECPGPLCHQISPIKIRNA